MHKPVVREARKEVENVTVIVVLELGTRVVVGEHPIKFGRGTSAKKRGGILVNFVHMVSLHEKFRVSFVLRPMIFTIKRLGDRTPSIKRAISEIEIAYHNGEGVGGGGEGPVKYVDRVTATASCTSVEIASVQVEIAIDACELQPGKMSWLKNFPLTGEKESFKMRTDVQPNTPSFIADM